MARVLKFIGYTFGLLALLFALSWLIYMPNSKERGAWRAQTGGAVLHLTPLKATLYSESSHSCLQSIAFPAHMKLVELAEGARVAVEGDQLLLSVDGSLEVTRFDRLDALPADCTNQTSKAATPNAIFMAAWTAMDEHYAFFDLHGVDWDARKELQPDPSLTRQYPMTDAEVNDMLLEMTAGLDDGHVHFGNETFGYDSPSQRPDWIPEGASLNRDILNDIAMANAGTSLTQAGSDPIFYGLRRDGIGYILIKEMDVRVPFGSDSMTAAAEVFDVVLTALADAKALVIDVRYNPGGSDTVSFGVAGHFTAAPLPVFTKTTRDGQTQSAPFTAVLKPFDQTADTRPVILMTSELTGSAAEILTLAMRTLPNVTTLGEPTGGGLSDVMGFMLPNGWGLGLSNQTYLTMDGELFEGIGIPPDIAVPYETPEFLAGRDPVLAAAFAQAISEMN